MTHFVSVFVIFLSLMVLMQLSSFASAQNATFAPPPPPATTAAPSTTVADELTLAPPAPPTTTGSPQVQKAEAVAEGSSITAGIMSATAAISTAAGPVVASVASRVGAIQKLAGCKPSLGEELAFFANPTGASLTLGTDKEDEDVRFHVGAILANVGIICVFALLSLLVAAVHNRFLVADRDRGITEMIGPLNIALRSYGVARWPGVFVFPCMFMVQPLIASGLTTFIYGKTGAAVIGVFGLLVIIGLIAQIAMSVVRTDGFLCTYRTAEQLHKEDKVRKALEKEGFCTSLANFYIHHIECIYGKYYDLPFEYEKSDSEVRAELSLHKLVTAELTGKHSHYLRRYGAGFDNYKIHTRWYMLIEISVGVVLGIVDSVSDKIGCVDSAYIVVVIFCVYFLSIPILRPFSSRLYLVFSSMISFFQMLGALLLTVLPETLSKDATERIVIIITTLALFLAIVQASLLLIQDTTRFVIDTLRRRSAMEKRALHVEAALKKDKKPGGVDGDAEPLLGKDNEEMIDQLVPGRKKNSPRPKKKNDDDDDIPLPSAAAVAAVKVTTTPRKKREDFDEFADYPGDKKPSSNKIHEERFASSTSATVLPTITTSSPSVSSTPQKQMPVAPAAAPAVPPQSKRGDFSFSSDDDFHYSPPAVAVASTIGSTSDNPGQQHNNNNNSSGSSRTHPRYQKARQQRADEEMREFEEAKYNSASAAAFSRSGGGPPSPVLVPQQQQQQPPQPSVTFVDSSNGTAAAPPPPPPPPPLGGLAPISRTGSVRSEAPRVEMPLTALPVSPPAGPNAGRRPSLSLRDDDDDFEL